MLISVVIPVYKAKECLTPLYERLSRTLSAINHESDYEIIFVEDRGRDGSWEVLESLAARDRRLCAVQMSRNFGQPHSITAGLSIARGDWAVIMDCDLQDRPEDIPALWSEAKQGFDVVNARRIGRRGSLWRRLASRVYHALVNYCAGFDYDPRVANFRMISRKVIDSYLTMGESSRSFGALVHWLGFDTTYVDVRHEGRAAGRSSYSLSKLLAMTIDAVTSFSNKPLRVSVWIGLSISLAAIGASFFLVVRKLVWGVSVEGWVGLMVSVWFLGGMIIANMGIVGLYIGKIYDETRHRPIYVISKKINC